MASSTESETHTSPESRPKTKAGSIRKLRTPKACYPCYRRKVKCDRNSPCALCVKRGYAHLCTFTHPPTTTKTRISPQAAAHRDTWNSDNNIGNHCCDGLATNSTRTHISGDPIVTDSGNVLVDTQEWQYIQDKLAALSQSMHSLRSQLEISVSPKEMSPKTPPDNNTLSPILHRPDEEKAEGVRTQNALGGSPVHCGSDSVMAFLVEKSQNNQSVFSENSVLSQLVLDNQSATYPFLDLWSSHITSYSNESVCTALPDDNICRRLLRSYHDVRLTLYPVIADFGQFQKDVYTMLENRALQGLCTNNGMSGAEPFGYSIAFVGILFAVLASGCQVSDFTKDERISMCQLYISCAYQCLRNGNFLSRPNMEAIQTLLIIGDVLSYNMNPGIAYVTFGVAQRMALTLGLHAESFIFKDPGATRRQDLWWSMAWQDSHFGLSYDRPVETLAACPPIPRAADSRPGMRGYFETMCSVISLILQLLREETLSENKISDHTIPAYKTELDKILADAAPHLRSEDYCFTLKNHVERLTLKLRSSYLISEICRRSLKQSPSGDGKPAMAPHLCQECIDSLISTIEAYIEMHQILPHGSRSWIHLHSAISAAFLLSVDEGAQLEPTVWAMLDKLEKVFCDLTSADQSPDQLSHSPNSGREWSPFSTALNSNLMSDHLIEHLPSYGKTFMLSDFPLGAESLMQGGGGGGFNPRVMPSSSGGVEFLTGTLNSLRKINAGFKLQMAQATKPKVIEKKAGACCLSRNPDAKSTACYSRKRNHV
ncbi:hypothetical protein UA08_08068 [Talaromyces atroroseus]|uniref:Zn(2)-C6 fungal-type domain-containing protein n=1 Tax=Talaromyces atroroseus TaxID=1441469 RepID=A0A225ALX9_TALAT|nr:hypothetical protein UA08_08068 [Talaromyces atroroseus]OKL56569.1 hypothetical protein UA08_08068 [Talaromyces atroroseus]